MEKINKNPLSEELGLGYVEFDQDLYFSILDGFVTNALHYESILMSALLYSKGFNSAGKAEETVKKLFDDDHDYFAEKYDEQELSKRLWSPYVSNTDPVSWDYLFKKTIICFIKYPNGVIAKLMMAVTLDCAVKISENDPRKVIIQKLVTLFFEKNHDHMEGLVIAILKKLSDKPFEQNWCSAHGLTLIAHKVIDAGKEYFCMTLVAFHDYLGRTWIADPIAAALQAKGCDFEVLYQELHEKEVWPWYKKENLEEKWYNLVHPHKELSKREHLSKSLNAMSLWSLVPLILKAQKYGDGEIISRLLWFISRKERTQKTND